MSGRRTSAKEASEAAKVLSDPNSTAAEKRLAGSVLSQRSQGK